MMQDLMIQMNTLKNKLNLAIKKEKKESENFQDYVEDMVLKKLEEVSNIQE